MAQTPLDAAGASASTTQAAQPAPSAGASLSASDLQHFIFWGIGAVALIVLADFAPRQAMLLTGIVGASVVFRFNTQLQAAIASVTAGAGVNTGGSEPSGTHPSDTSGAGQNQSGLGTGRRSNVVRYPTSPFMRDLMRSSGRGA